LAEIYLVRHGQASFGAENYDQLSQLGHLQAARLGDYFRKIGVQPDRLVSGSLSRQIDTMTGLDFPTEVERNEDFNEFDFQTVLRQVHGDDVETQIKTSPRVFEEKLSEAVLAWQSDAIKGSFESWTEFSDRVQAGFKNACRPGANCVVVVTSGGVISHLVTKLLGAPDSKMIEINLIVKNSSYTRIFFSGERISLSEFNSTPHLDIEPATLSYA
jgi:broad specificity phosphatase PhoE